MTSRAAKTFEYVRNIVRGEFNSTMTKSEIEARISLLADEMDANDEENRWMQREIDGLYAMLYKMDKLEAE
jgi:hypothetical protein